CTPTTASDLQCTATRLASDCCGIPRAMEAEERRMRLKDKVAIVTGAASGMGAATARRFAEEGAKVVVADMLAAEGEAVAASISGKGQTAVFQSLDVTDEQAWRAAVEATVERFGRLDVVVNNAGISGSA